MTDSDRPHRVCLVGSSRFKRQFHEAGAVLEKAGNLVLMMAFFQHADGVPVSDEERAVLDRLDYARIALCDEVVVIDGMRLRCARCKRWFDTINFHCCAANDVEHARYIGESTSREIAYAESVGKPVKYWSNADA